MRRQTVKAIRLTIVDVLRDHQHTTLDDLVADVPCECPPEDYEYYKSKLREAWRGDGDVMKVHAEHVAWAVAKVLAKEDE